MLKMIHDISVIKRTLGSNKPFIFLVDTNFYKLIVVWSIFIITNNKTVSNEMWRTIVIR